MVPLRIHTRKHENAENFSLENRSRTRVASLDTDPDPDPDHVVPAVVGTTSSCDIADFEASVISYKHKYTNVQ